MTKEYIQSQAMFRQAIRNHYGLSHSEMLLASKPLRLWRRFIVIVRRLFGLKDIIR